MLFLLNSDYGAMKTILKLKHFLAKVWASRQTKCISPPYSRMRLYNWASSELRPPLSKRWVGHVLPVPPVNSFPARSTSAKDWLNDREFFKSIIVNLKKLKLTFYAKGIMTNTINKNPCPRNLVTKNSKPSARAETKFYGATKKLTFHNFESGLRKRYRAHKRLKLF